VDILTNRRRNEDKEKDEGKGKGEGKDDAKDEDKGIDKGKGRITASLLGNRLIVWDPSEGSELYRKGYYGKPVGIPKPKSPSFDVPLILDAMEGLYLQEKGIIKVLDQLTGKTVSKRSLKKIASEFDENFEDRYEVYKDLRERGYVVTSGIKFGCDFAVYKQGPGIDHAPFMIQVRRPEDRVSATDIVRAGRLATTVRKRFILAIRRPKLNRIDYLMFRWWKA
jgi:tRNA-intron endonuclease